MILNLIQPIFHYRALISTVALFPLVSIYNKECLKKEGVYPSFFLKEAESEKKFLFNISKVASLQL